MAFKLFSKFGGKKAAKSDDSACEVSTTCSSSRDGSGRIQPASSSKHRMSKKTKGGKSKVIEKSPNIQTAEALIENFNNFQTEEELLKLFVNPDKAAFMFEDGFKISPRQWVQSVASTNASFPDMKFDFETIQQTSPTAVVIENLQFKGTHTGEPCTFAPKFPAIPAAGAGSSIGPGGFAFGGGTSTSGGSGFSFGSKA